jgi:TolB-like protein/Flp pilus assembly protein TadD
LLYLFDDYELDTERRELRRGADRVTMQPQVFDVLEYLIRHRDRVVSKDDLLAAVWNGRIISDSGLTSRISAARTAIGDSGEAQRLIRTLPRKGIRFVGEVREQESAAGATAIVEQASQQAVAPAPAAAAAVSADSDPQRPGPNFVLAEKAALAVLPFTNMSGDPEQEYFADGIVEDILTALSRFRSFAVISRNSSFTYKGRSVDVKEVARELGVRYVLEGSIRRAADRVRITGQLIDAESGAHLWAGRYDGDLGDVFALQDRVTAEVAAAIEPRVLAAEIARATRKSTSTLAAYDYCLQARWHALTPTRQSLDTAMKLLRAAVEIDPAYAQAWMIMALCANFRYVMGDEDDRIAAIISEGLKYAREAVACDRDDAEVLAVAGHMTTMAGDHDAAVELLNRALVLNPHSNTVCVFSGWGRVCSGEFDAGVALLRASLVLDPLSPQAVIALGGIAAANFFQKRYDEAVVWARRAIARHPDLTVPYRFLAAALAQAGQLEEARATIAELLRRQPKSSLTRSHHSPFRHAWMMDLYIGGLRRAGLPE